MQHRQEQIGGTYCGNPLACAAAIKTMEIMKEEDYCAKSLHIGSVVRKAFEEMKEKYDIIGDVRGNRRHARCRICKRQRK